MSFADLQGPMGASANWLRTQSRNYGFGFVAVCAAAVAQRGLEVAISFPHSFLMFYPTVLMVALLAGFWLGVVSTLLAVPTTIYLNMKSPGPWFVDGETERVGMWRRY